MSTQAHIKDILELIQKINLDDLVSMQMNHYAPDEVDLHLPDNIHHITAEIARLINNQQLRLEQNEGADVLMDKLRQPMLSNQPYLTTETLVKLRLIEDAVRANQNKYYIVSFAVALRAARNESIFANDEQKIADDNQQVQEEFSNVKRQIEKQHALVGKIVGLTLACDTYQQSLIAKINQYLINKQLPLLGQSNDINAEVDRLYQHKDLPKRIILALEKYQIMHDFKTRLMAKNKNLRTRIGEFEELYIAKLPTLERSRDTAFKRFIKAVAVFCSIRAAEPYVYNTGAKHFTRSVFTLFAVKPDIAPRAQPKRQRSLTL